MIKEPIKCNRINKEAFSYYNKINAPTLTNPNNYIKGLANGCSVLGAEHNICEYCEFYNSNRE